MRIEIKLLFGSPLVQVSAKPAVLREGTSSAGRAFKFYSQRLTFSDGPELVNIDVTGDDVVTTNDAADKIWANSAGKMELVVDSVNKYKDAEGATRRSFNIAARSAVSAPTTVPRGIVAPAPVAVAPPAP
jgi:hypothetical protein